MIDLDGEVLLFLFFFGIFFWLRKLEVKKWEMVFFFFGCSPLVLSILLVLFVDENESMKMVGLEWLRIVHRGRVWFSDVVG